MRNLCIGLLMLTAAAPAEAGVWRRIFHANPGAARKAWLLDPANEPKSRLPLMQVKGGSVPDDRGANPLQRTDVAQGKIKDCWLMSTLPGMLQIAPAAVDQLIHKTEGGNYEVTLFLGKRTKDDHGTVHRAPVTIGVRPSFPTKNGKPLYAGVKGGDLRIALLEKAYAKFEGRYEGVPPLITPGISGRINSGFEALLPEGKIHTRLAATHSTASIGQHLHEAFAEGRPVTGLLLTAFSPRSRRLFKKFGMTRTFHHYAVTGFDAERQLVELQDPHGQVIRDLPLADFKHLFATYVVGPQLSAQAEGEYPPPSSSARPHGM